jgi:hypothetical protein
MFTLLGAIIWVALVVSANAEMPHEQTLFLECF